VFSFSFLVHADPLGLQYIPQVNLSELSSLSPEKVDEIRQKGTVVIRDVVDDADAISWRQQLKEFVEANSDSIQGLVPTPFR